ncbi:hypothetical protein ANO14919_145740 [Xylariales sp. No.14919]|nr:hypothetical protein ANO14919_145740 [Xylariales sp. No.14919]
MMTANNSYLLSTHGDHTTTTNTHVSVSTDGLFAHTPEPQIFDLQAVSGSPLDATPLSYFETHREDRLMGAFAGLYPAPPPRGHQDYNSGHMLPRSAQDAMLLGIGAWAEINNLGSWDNRE